MRFDDRTYPDIVRDLLTTLTGGTVGEVHDIPEGGTDRIELRNTPVRRVSHLTGKVKLKRRLLDYRFTERDFQLVPGEDNPDEPSVIRFRPHGKQPAPSTSVVVNYYPTRTKPTPLNDVNVGSVVRTLLETVSREFAGQYIQLQRVYDSAFVETAQGSSLDKVVALVDVRRLRRGAPVGKVRFSRRSGAPGAVHIPAHTVVTDGAGTRYLTSQEGTLLPNQSSIELWIHGAERSTPLAESGVLSVLERALAGIDRVTNDEPTFLASEDETDDQLASRARRAIHGTGKGTLDAIRYGLESLPFVSSVSLQEFDGPQSAVTQPGVLRVEVALSEDNAYNRSLVDAKLGELRPAGIHIERNWSGKVEVGFEVGLHLAGASLPTSEIQAIEDGIRVRLREYVAGLGPGAVARRSRLLTLLLADERVVDAELMVRLDGTSTTGDTQTLPSDKAARPADPLVQFQPPTFEEQDAASESSLVQVDAHLVIDLVSVTLAEIESGLRSRLEQLLSNTQGGSELAFGQVLTALRDTEQPDRYAVRASESVLSLEPDQGAFTELRSGDSYALPKEATFVLRALNAVEGEV